MKYQLALAATYLAGTEAAVIGRGVPEGPGDYKILGNSFLNTPIKTANTPVKPANITNPFNVKNLLNELGDIEDNFDSMANPFGFWGFLPWNPPLDVSKLPGQLAQVPNSIKDAMSILTNATNANVNLTNADQKSVCTAIGNVLSAEKGLVTKLNTAFGDPKSELAKSLSSSTVGSSLTTADKNVDTLSSSVLQLAPSCMSGVNSTSAGINNVLSNIGKNAQKLPNNMGSNFANIIFKYLGQPGGTAPGGVAPGPLPIPTPVGPGSPKPPASSPFSILPVPTPPAGGATPPIGAPPSPPSGTPPAVSPPTGASPAPKPSGPPVSIPTGTPPPVPTSSSRSSSASPTSTSK